MSELLFETEGNPVPENARSGRIGMRDGVELRYAHFPASGRPLKGTVVLVQGRNECIEKYFETIRDLSGRGLGVLAYDLRGQGGSDRLLADPERGYVASFNDYVGDLEQVFDEIALPDCRAPYYVLGHSTGSLICLLAAPAMVNRIRRMVLVAPLLEFHSTRLSNAALRRLTGFAFSLGFGRAYLSGGPRPRQPASFASNTLTTDQDRFRRNQAILAAHPELALGGPTIAWVNAALRAIDRVEDPGFLANIHVPTLIVAAGADEVVATQATEAFATRLRSGSLLTIDGARHEILQEADRFREQFFAAFDAFVPGTDAPPA